MNSKTLSDLLKVSKGQIKLVFGLTLEARTSNGKYEIALFPGQEFPKGDYKTGENKISGTLLESILGLVSGSASDDR